MWGWTVKNGPLKPYIYLIEGMIDPNFRRKGIGTQLIKEVEKCAKDINASYIYCYMYGPSEPSIKFMEKMGYIKEKEIIICEMSTSKKERIKSKI